MKARIANLTSAIPFLVEYMPTQAESDEIDLFQDHKVTDFKRMILQNVKDGDKVGIPVPIGYDDIMVGYYIIFPEQSSHRQPSNTFPIA